MSLFLIVWEDARSSLLDGFFEDLGGRAINPGTGIVPWSGTAEQLRRRVAPVIQSPLVITELTGDWILGAA